MKHRPNISVQQKSNTKLEYLKYLAEENIQPNVSVPTFVAPTGKQKSKPNLNIQKRNLDKINQHRIDMMQWVNREVPVIADLLIEYSTYYILTITSYKLLFNNESFSSFNPNPDANIVGSGMFYNNTRCQVRDMTKQKC